MLSLDILLAFWESFFAYFALVFDLRTYLLLVNSSTPILTKLYLFQYMLEDDADFVVMSYNPEDSSQHGKWSTKGSTTFWEHTASYFCEFSEI